MGRGTTFFRRRPRPDPGGADDLARDLRRLWERLAPRRPPTREPKPVPPPPVTDTQEPDPQPERQRDPREDECVGNCDEDPNCPTKTFCLNKMKFVGTPKDALYDAHLRVQKATMNTMSPGQVLANRANYEVLGRRILERMPAVRQSRNSVIQRWERNNPGQNWRAQGLETLHRLDMGAGGSPTGYFDMGDASINRSIGGSWPSKTEQLKQHARNL